MKSPKNIQRICKNCKLFNPEKQECSVVILHEGSRLKLPVDPNDSCFFEDQYFDPITQTKEKFSGDVKEVKFWVENQDGSKIKGDGIVKIEYPEGFFGEGIDKIIN